MKFLHFSSNNNNKLKFPKKNLKYLWLIEDIRFYLWKIKLNNFHSYLVAKYSIEFDYRVTDFVLAKKIWLIFARIIPHFSIGYSNTEKIRLKNEWDCQTPCKKILELPIFGWTLLRIYDSMDEQTCMDDFVYFLPNMYAFQGVYPSTLMKTKKNWLLRAIM